MTATLRFGDEAADGRLDDGMIMEDDHALATTRGATEASIAKGGLEGMFGVDQAEVGPRQRFWGDILSARLDRVELCHVGSRHRR